jgi:hypothetical protein
LEHNVTMTHEDLADAGRLIAWAAKPKDRPARHGDYARVVQRYLHSEEFAVTADTIAAGAGLTLTVDAEVGVIAVAESDSPLRMTLADFRYKVGAAERRSLHALVLLAIARAAFPNPAQLDDRLRVARVSVAGVVDYLGRLVGVLEDTAEDPDADAPELVELWRSWSALRESRHDAQRMSGSSRNGAVTKMCRFLEEQGHLVEIDRSDGGTYRVTPRFRVAVITLAEDSGVFADLLSLASTTTDNVSVEVTP